MTPRLSTSSTAPAWTSASERSLYDLLAEPVGTAISSGETRITKTPETVDEGIVALEETSLYV
jgi:hypothetical protein